MKNKGFTLVELVITIAIVIILSVVSVPIYRGYIEKAKMSEGYTLLGAILSAQKNYYSEYGYFLDDNQSGFWNHNNSVAGLDGRIFQSFSSVLGIDARGNKYFSLFYINSDDGSRQFFTAQVLKPTEMISGNNSFIGMYYNITAGATVR